MADRQADDELTAAIQPVTANLDGSGVTFGDRLERQADPEACGGESF